MLNSVNLVGRLTRDPDLRKTQNGKSVANFTIAVDRGFGDNKRTDFVNLQAWGSQADFLSQYIKKGYLVLIEGHIQSRSYDDNDGRRVYIQEVLVRNIKSLETRESVANVAEHSPAVTNESNLPDTYDDSPVLDITSDDLPF